ncbi:MAG: transposase [Candidatus Omnitrophica bacterium]|nr:transposase [Candidatus Omnitrophota bacterium]
MPRIARIIAQGFPHHVIQRGNNHQQVFFDDDDRHTYIAFLQKYGRETDCDVMAFCLMPNHVHVLAVPHTDESLSKFMQKLSLTYTQHVNRKYNRTGRLWECRFFSSLIERQTYLWRVCRYIERNPVRHALIERPEEYTWSSAGMKYAFVAAAWDSAEEKQKYCEFMQQPEVPEDVECIRKSIRGCRPVGNEAFIETVSNSIGINLKFRPRGRPRKQTIKSGQPVAV